MTAGGDLDDERKRPAEFPRRVLLPAQRELNARAAALGLVRRRDQHPVDGMQNPVRCFDIRLDETDAAVQ